MRSPRSADAPGKADVAEIDRVIADRVSGTMENLALGIVILSQLQLRSVRRVLG